MKISKAVIPAAGLGTRLLPATKAMPKEMLPIVDKPAIQYIVEEAVASGIDDILIIIGRDKAPIVNHFDKSVELELALKKSGKDDMLKTVEDITNMADIHFIRQKEPKGLGDAVHCAKKFIGDEPFAVLLGDDVIDAQTPVLKQMVDVFGKYPSSIIGVQPVPHEKVNKYGIVDSSFTADRLSKVKDLVEKPNANEAPTDLAILGRYILTPGIFDMIEKTKPGANGEIQLTDAIKALLKNEDVYAYNFIGKRYDIGDKLSFLMATVEFALKRDDLKEAFGNYLYDLVNDNNEAFKEAASTK